MTKKTLKVQTVDETFGSRKTTFLQEEQVAFWLYEQRKMAYLPRYWVVRNEREYKALTSYLCQIDAVVHPVVISYPQHYELQNRGNGPWLEPIKENA